MFAALKCVHRSTRQPFAEQRSSVPVDTYACNQNFFELLIQWHAKEKRVDSLSFYYNWRAAVSINRNTVWTKASNDMWRLARYELGAMW